MNEQRLLDQAAKAAGLIKHKYCDAWKAMAAYTVQDGFYGPTWNPLKDDGDALRLAALLKMDIEFFGSVSDVRASRWHRKRHYEAWGEAKDDMAKALRLAITRVAADIGRNST